MLKDEDYSKIEYVYDNKNRKTEAKYFDTSSLKYIVKYQYNSKGLITEMARFDKQGNLMNDDYGIAKRTWEYEKNEVVPVVEKWYNSRGEYIYYRNYNKDKGEWGDLERPAGAWQSDIRDLKRSLPMQIDDGLVLKDVQYTSNSVTFIIRCTGVSIRTLSAWDFELLIDWFREYKSDISERLPRNVRCKLLVQDRTGNELFTL